MSEARFELTVGNRLWPLTYLCRISFYYINQSYFTATSLCGNITIFILIYAVGINSQEFRRECHACFNGILM